MALFSRRREPTATAPPPTGTVVRAPVAGTTVPLAEVADPVFAGGVMGAGLGIVPADGEVRAPVAGTVVTAFPTGHAYGIRTAAGVEVLVHVGLDTVELDGRGFSRRVETGQTVAVGDLLAVVDMAVLQAAAKDTTTVVTVINSRAFAAVEPTSAGHVGRGDPVLTVSAERAG